VKFKSLCRRENIAHLIALLEADIAPRSQRLILRLCYRLLPFQQDNIQTLIELFLDRIGNLLFERSYFAGLQKALSPPALPPSRPPTIPSTTPTTTTVTESKSSEQQPPISSNMEIESALSSLFENITSKDGMKPHEPSEREQQQQQQKEDDEKKNLIAYVENEDDEYSSQKKEQEYGVYLNYWSPMPKQLMEVILFIFYLL
jgi:hypothetical protein